MASHAKTLEKISRRPPPADLKWSELKGALESLGYVMKSGSGSRRKFFHKAKNALIICHQPHPSPDVDKGCVDDIRDHLIEQNFIEG
jgi:hypothetical protein